MEDSFSETITRKYKILIVEDTPFMPELLKKSMTMWDIFESADAEDGVKKARL